MDKRTLAAFGLIGMIFLAWTMFMQPSADEQPPKPRDTTPSAPARIDPVQKPAPAVAAPLKGVWAALDTVGGRYITIETPLYRAIVNARGALISRVQLLRYKTWYGDTVQLVNDSAGFPGELALSFRTRDGQQVSTENFTFQIDPATPPVVKLGDSQSFTLVARLPISGRLDTSTTDSAAPPSASSSYIEKRFVFRGGSYGIGVDVKMNDMAEIIDGGAYQISWRGGMKYQEHNSVEESSFTKTIVTTNDDKIEVTNDDVRTSRRDTVRGQVDWVGMKTKYFATALIPSKPIPNSSVLVSSTVLPADSNGMYKSFGYALSVPYASGTSSNSFTLFAGPLAYDVTKSFGLQSMMEFGIPFLIRPIAEFFMLPIFRAIHAVISNWGLVIIVFSLFIRGLLWPLSIPQIKSSRKTQLLQPMITEAREKFKDDPQRQQMETMKIYQQYGVNPVSGCLPLVLQLPILYALYETIRSAIDLRQANFALWIHDLSIPDVVATLPFQIPLLGDKLSGLALIMGATLFIQQKMMISDPKQKALVYMMPVLLTLTFNHLPSGLNLYYLTFNLLSIGQQVYLTKYAKNKMTLEDMAAEAKTKKKGWLASKMAEAQKLAEMQRGTAGEGRTPVEPRKKK